MTKFPVTQSIKHLNFDYFEIRTVNIRIKLCMTTTTRCHVMLMMQTYHESSEDSPSCISIEVLHHVLKNVLRITTDERVSFMKWMQYHGYLIIQEIYQGDPYILEDFHKYYLVNGQHCALKSSTINTINLFMDANQNKSEDIGPSFSIFSFHYIPRIQ